ncbi:LysR family transcriptional regulator [Lactobacillus sp. CC-MHH1034]|uniref:LysR substrate-binding domain-containing protein n=1 Tax=Agrilactobacillus fermenti TaxID=2586909 RepID=UPI001E3CBA3C|nr:LysR family transcriptional regulator [Agrilactobacillus fermenti]MCD2256912.1 LysR family transcriptional regulator [Agrilactobacillus fermenti]
MSRNIKRFLEAIHQYQSISKAATALYVTQPYISQTIHKYEKQYGVSLLDRGKNKTDLTVAGLKLLHYLQSCAQRENQFAQEMASIAHYHTGAIKFGTNQPLGRYLLPDIFPDFHKAYPNIAVQLLELPTQRAAYLLNSNELDIFYGMQTNLNEIQFLPLKSNHYYWIIAKGSDQHTRYKTKAIKSLTNFELLNNTPLINVTSHSKFQQNIDQFLLLQGLHPKIIATVPDLDIATKMVGNHVASTFTTYQAIQQNNLTLDPKISIYQLPKTLLSLQSGISTRMAPTPPIQKLTELITQVVV